VSYIYDFYVFIGCLACLGLSSILAEQDALAASQPVVIVNEFAETVVVGAHQVGDPVHNKSS
jgi:hypothetical protein